jgi:hypothetical protein
MNLPLSHPTHFPNQISAEARGRRRVWRRQREAAYTAAVETLFATIKRPVVEDFMFKASVGRRRVFDRIDQQLRRHGAVLQALRLEGKSPCAIWAVLRPRSALTLNPHPDLPGDDQDCVTVNYLTLGATPDAPTGALGEGLWTLEIKDHAIGRFFERGDGGPDQAIFAVHDALLNVDSRDLQDRPRSVRLRVGNDVWCGEVRAGFDVSIADFGLHVIVRTHLGFDQLSPGQEFGLIQPRPQAGPYRLGEGWLAPPPFRTLQVDGDRVTIDGFTPPPPLFALANSSTRN